MVNYKKIDGNNYNNNPFTYKTLIKVVNEKSIKSNNLSERRYGLIEVDKYIKK